VVGKDKAWQTMGGDAHGVSSLACVFDSKAVATTATRPSIPTSSKLNKLLVLSCLNQSASNSPCASSAGNEAHSSQRAECPVHRLGASQGTRTEERLPAETEVWMLENGEQRVAKRRERQRPTVRSKLNPVCSTRVLFCRVRHSKTQPMKASVASEPIDCTVCRQS